VELIWVRSLGQLYAVRLLKSGSASAGRLPQSYISLCVVTWWYHTGLTTLYRHVTWVLQSQCTSEMSVASLLTESFQESDVCVCSLFRSLIFRPVVVLAPNILLSDAVSPPRFLEAIHYWVLRCRSMFRYPLSCWSVLANMVLGVSACVSCVRAFFWPLGRRHCSAIIFMGNGSARIYYAWFVSWPPLIVG
jgi:hypothetical protein